MGDHTSMWRMGMGSGSHACIARGGVPVTDAAIQSAINTLRNWRMRREVKGKTPSAEDVQARIKELWPHTSAADAAEIVKGTMP